MAVKGLEQAVADSGLKVEDMVRVYPKTSPFGTPYETRPEPHQCIEFTVESFLTHNDLPCASGKSLHTPIGVTWPLSGLEQIDAPSYPKDSQE